MGTSYHDRLEGGYQLLRVRRFKAWTSAVLIALAAGLAAISLAVAGASARPLFMPIGPFVVIALILLLIGMVLWMFFRNIEVRYLRKDSQRFLMVRDAMRRAEWTAVICVIIAVILFAPPTKGAVNGSLTGPPISGHITVSQMTWALVFDNQDAFGLTPAVAVLVDLTAGTLSATVDGHPAIAFTRGVPYTISLDSSSFHTYSITFSTTAGADFTYQVQRELIPAAFTAVPGIAVVFAIVGVAYFIYLRPRREQLEKASIYSAEYQTRLDEGERLYTEYELTKAPGATPAPAGATEASISAPEPAPAFEPAALPPTPFPTSAPSAPVLPPAPPLPPPSAPVAEPRLAPVQIPVAEPPPPTADLLFREGASLFSDGRYEEAIKRFDEVLRLDPKSSRAFLAKGNALLRSGRIDEALETFDAILMTDRGNLDALLGTAGVYSARHRWRDVVDLADTYLAIRPGDPDMLTYRGDAQLALARRSEARVSYEAALLKKPGDPSLLSKIEGTKLDVATLQSRALLASASGNLDQAIALFDEVLKVEPDNANALTGKAVALKRAGKVDDALACLNKVLSTKPDHGGALLNRGRILEERGEFDDALEAYDKLIELSPGDADAWIAQGDVLAKTGRQTDAIKSYNEALKVVPNDDETRAKIRDLEKVRESEGDLLQELFQIKGIGPAKARTLRDAGFRTREDFAKATEEDLLKVHGVSKKLAADIVRHFHPA